MHDGSSASRVPLCRICNQPVWLDEAKTDEDGQAIHEGCYVAKIHLVRSEHIFSDGVPFDGDRSDAQSPGPMDAAKKKPSREG